MGMRRVFILFACILMVGLFGGQHSARAITVNTGDTITASLNGLPGSTQYVLLSIPIEFGAPDFFTVGTSFRLNLFDATNVLLAQSSFAGHGETGTVISLFGPFVTTFDNTAYLFIDQIVGPIDIRSIGAQGDSFRPDGSCCAVTSLVKLPFEANTPLPAAFPLFATGLGGLGLLGWRRKKKAAAFAV